MNGDLMEADHRRLDYIFFTDDEEVMILPHKRDLEVPDNPDTDIRERPDMSDTQREDWLLQTEPLHGARPRERPPVINDRWGGLDLEAAGGGCGGPEDGSKQNPAPLLPIERQILLEGEVTTPPRGGGGVRAPSLMVHHRGGGGAAEALGKCASRDSHKGRGGPLPHLGEPRRPGSSSG